METTNATMCTLGEKLRRLRERKEFHQDEVAGQLHVTRQTVSGWECGASVPKMDYLKRLSEIYEVPLSELTGMEEKDEKEKDGDLAETGEESVEKISEIWQDSEKMKKLLISCLIIVAVPLTMKIPCIGLAVSVISLIGSRKCHIQSRLLDVIILFCMAVELWDICRYWILTLDDIGKAEFHFRWEK